MMRNLAAAVAAMVIAGTALSAQRPGRTPDGHPDLQGTWLNNTATPLERPKEAAGRTSFTDAEARDYVQRYQLDRTAALTRDDPRFELDVAGDIDTYEPGPLLPGNRTAIITEPADGRIPALTPEAQKRLTDRTAHLNAHYAENPEDFPNAERCLVVANTSSPPMMPAFYNNGLQIVQAGNYVMILSEMIHDARIVALDRRTHLPAGLAQWKGDSIGRWEGDTLVVDTTNFTTKTAFRGSGTGLHVVERFTLSGADTLKYQFTVDDPASFAQSWSGESVLTRTGALIYEYACHEANYSLTNVMRGRRSVEAAGATKD